MRSLQQELANRNEQLRDLEKQLRDERKKTHALEVGVAQLRQVLEPLFRGLQMVFGEIDALDIEARQSHPQAQKSSAAWESWKQRLGGQTAKAIDALLLHGSLTQTQLRIHIGCARGSVPGIVYQLNKAGLINKDGNQISLKDI
ncbi:MAG TPA: hypothetical protein VFE27_24225 [Acidobacteriaceae bacterium]|nr:hypothetical protein [Acidobacteriaceae bacterium]